MGLAKRYMEEMEGLYPSRKFICEGCLTEPGLQTAIREEAIVRYDCSFCDRSPAAPFDSLSKAFHSALLRDYEDGANYYMGGMEDVAPILTGEIDTWDAIEELCDVYEPFVEGYRDGILEELHGCIEDRSWVENDWQFIDIQTALNEAWAQFAFSVKHKWRFTLWAMSDDDERNEHEQEGAVHPANLLRRIHELILEMNLVKSFDPGTKLYRARAQSKERPAFELNASQTGTIPAEFATQPNRMSPMGIPLFYGAFDAFTARTEAGAIDTDGYEAQADFGTTKVMRVVDLTDLPMPSIFDPNHGHRWREVSFLHNFVGQINQPVEDARAHLDYVPMQVVTEYLNNMIFGNSTVDGLLYPSAKVPGSKCLALKISSDDCLEPGSELTPERLQVVLQEATWVHNESSDR